MIGLRPSIDDENMRSVVQQARERVEPLRGMLGDRGKGMSEVLLAATLAAEPDAEDIDQGLARLLVLPRELTLTQGSGDPSKLLGRAETATGRERVELLESAWRLVPAPAIAELVAAAAAGLAEAPFVAPKRKTDIEARWMEAVGEGASPEMLFQAPWPTQWRAAQRRMSALYARPPSPRLGAAAVGLACRDPKPYTSIASQIFWQALAWFIAEQRDVRQVEALAAFERELARFVRREETPAADALAAYKARVSLEVPTRLRSLVEKLQAQLGSPRATKVSSRVAPNKTDSRLVWADELLAKVDPRGELVVVQEQIVSKEPTPALLERQAQLLKKHAKEWCPPSLHKGGCVFRLGVPVAGHLMFQSDRELASLSSSASLATTHTLVVDRFFAMGRVRPETVADFVRSLSSLERVRLDDESAQLLAQGKASSVEHVAIGGERAVELEGPGLPRLRRCDFEQLRKSWLKQPWFRRLEAIGCAMFEDWLSLRDADLSGSLVLCSALRRLHRTCPHDAGADWELWASRSGAGWAVEARPVEGSTRATLANALARIAALRCTTLRVPQNYLTEVKALASKQKSKVTVEATDPCWPERLGQSLDGATAFLSRARTASKPARAR